MAGPTQGLRAAGWEYLRKKSQAPVPGERRAAELTRLLKQISCNRESTPCHQIGRAGSSTSTMLGPSLFALALLKEHCSPSLAWQ